MTDDKKPVFIELTKVFKQFVMRPQSEERPIRVNVNNIQTIEKGGGTFMADGLFHRTTRITMANGSLEVAESEDQINKKNCCS